MWQNCGFLYGLLVNNDSDAAMYSGWNGTYLNIAASRDFHSIARLFCWVPGGNGQLCIARNGDLLTSIRPVDTGWISVPDNTLSTSHRYTTCCSVRRWLLVVSACCWSGGPSVCWYLAQSCIKFWIYFCYTDHICNLRPHRHSCCLTIKTDCRNTINSLQILLTYYLIFTALCTLVQSTVLRSHVACLSVRNVGGLLSHRLEFFENNFTIS